MDPYVPSHKFAAYIFVALLFIYLLGCEGHHCTLSSLNTPESPRRARRAPLCRNQAVMGPLVASNSSDEDTIPFQPRSCRFRHWDRLSAQSCLRGRQVFVIGNSVAREFYGHFHEWICAESRDRTEEKFICKSDTGFCSKRCPTHLDEEFGIRFSHYFTNRMSDPLPNGFRYHDGDKCTSSARECLARVLSESQPGDVLVFFVGVALAWEFKHVTNALAGNETAMAQWPPGTGDGDPEPHELLQFDSIVNSSARSWRDIVHAAWRGSDEDVYRIRNAPLCPQCPQRWKNSPYFLESTSALIHRANLLQDVVYGEAGSRSTLWGVVDQEAINSAGGASFYSDFIRKL